jgi:hypothetical protein
MDGPYQQTGEMKTTRPPYAGTKLRWTSEILHCATAHLIDARDYDPSTGVFHFANNDP